MTVSSSPLSCGECLSMHASGRDLKSGLSLQAGDPWRTLAGAGMLAASAAALSAAVAEGRRASYSAA